MPDPDDVRFWAGCFALAVLLVAVAWAFIASAFASPTHAVQVVPVNLVKCGADG